LKINKTFIKRSRIKLKIKRKRTGVKISITKRTNLLFSRDEREKNVLLTINHSMITDMCCTVRKRARQLF